jgi:hypothetical protein
MSDRHKGRLAGLAALASCALTVAAIPLSGHGSAAAVGPGAAPDKAVMLLDFHRFSSDQLLAGGARALSLVLVALVSVYLFRVTRRRNPAHGRAVPIACMVGCACLVASTVLGFVALEHVAGQFAAFGTHTARRATRLLDASAALRAVGVTDLLAGLVLGVWTAAASYQAMRAGLLTRSLAGIGVVAGLMSAITLPSGPALFIAWLGGVGLLALGYWPGGRPSAWREQAAPELEAGIAEVH